MVNAKYVGGHVFRGIVFESTELGPGSVRLVMRNANYPLDHFRGLLYEWLHYSGLRGTVLGELREPSVHVYTMRWSMRTEGLRSQHA
jgi:hypothetical protein